MDKKIGLWELFKVFLKIGTVTFGGGYAMLPFIFSEICSKRKWFDENELMDILTVSQTVPGAIAVNAAFNIGMCKRGIAGGVAAVLGMVLPAFLAVVLILMFFINIREMVLVRKFINGVIVASAALIILSAIKLAGSVYKKGGVSNILISLFVFLAITVFNADIIWLLLFGIAVGLLKYFHKNKEKCL